MPGDPLEKGEEHELEPGWTFRKSTLCSSVLERTPGGQCLLDIACAMSARRRYTVFILLSIAGLLLLGWLNTLALPSAETVEFSSGPRVLCVTFVGRLGNQLFQYAAVLGLSLKLNRIPVYSLDSEMAKALQVPPPTWYHERCNRAAEAREQACCKTETGLLQLDPKKDFALVHDSYLQSWKYFENHEEHIRQAFKFRSDIQAVADRAVKGYRQSYNNNTLVGIHIRRGDYLLEKHTSIGYLIAPGEYFVKAMKYMRDTFGNVTFVVSTDDENWFRQEVENSNDVVFWERQTPALDMALLASLDHVIISVGTYSWWVGFLNRGVTVYYKDFISPNTFIGDQFNPDGSEYIYPGWIPM
ncbi:hypothetical protein BaRGS_00022739 [Batillaria attramentaria]|uniref:L-Fucosyltransferase n=1 Tax=Batillaria attramentaria TaxID=370345 RepID=A0ABD0KG07_9CAEN